MTCTCIDIPRSDCCTCGANDAAEAEAIRRRDLHEQFDALWERVAPLLPRAWEQVVAELACSPPSPESIERMREKALAGHLEHGGDVVGWRSEDFAREVNGELADLIVYRAMRIAILGS